MLQPLSEPLQPGLRLLPDPLPAAPKSFVRAAFPPSLPRGGREGGRATGLPRCAEVTRSQGRSSSPVVQHLRRGKLEPPDLTTCHFFGSSVSASCACSK